MNNYINHEPLKARLAVASFIAALVFGVAGFCCPPLSIIDSSVLYFTGQIFLFCATILGVNLNLGKFGKTEQPTRDAETDA